MLAESGSVKSAWSRDYMRILLVVPQDEEVGGVAYVVGNLARYLQGRGHEVIFLFPGNSIFLKPKVTKGGIQALS